jgi:hypothetical protein
MEAHGGQIALEPGNGRGRRSCSAFLARAERRAGRDRRDRIGVGLSFLCECPDRSRRPVSDLNGDVKMTDEADSGFERAPLGRFDPTTGLDRMLVRDLC